jgi:hypothetical protein
MVFKFRSLLADEHGVKCAIMKPNHLQCQRRVTRVVYVQSNNTDSQVLYVCEGDFQVMFQTAIADKEIIVDMDAAAAEKLSVLEPITGDRSLSEIELNKAAGGAPLPTTKK